MHENVSQTLYVRNFNLIIRFASSSAKLSFADAPFVLLPALVSVEDSTAIPLLALNKFRSTKNPGKARTIKKH